MALLQLPVPRLPAAGGVPERRIGGGTSFLSSVWHGGGGCDHIWFTHSRRGCNQSSPRSDFRRTQKNVVISQRSSGRKQDGYGTTVRSDPRRNGESNIPRQLLSERREDGYRTYRADSEKNDFDPEVSSRSYGYRTSRADSEKDDFDPEVSSRGKHDGSASPSSAFGRGQGRKVSSQRFSGGGRDGYTAPPSQRFSGGGRDGYTAPNSQRSSGGGRDGYIAPNSQRFSGGGRDGYTASNSQRFSGGGRDGYNAPPAQSRRTQSKNFDLQRGGVDRENYTGRSGSSGRGTREKSNPQGTGKVSGRNNSTRTLNPIPKTITRRQSTSQFVSDRTVHRAPWEQGGKSSSDSSGFLERNFTERNPLVERLQRMQEEVENDEEDDDDDVDDDVGGLDDDRGFRQLDDDSIASFEGRGEKSAMARIAEKLSSIPGSRSIYEPKNRAGVGLREGPDPTFGPKYGQPMFPTVGRDWSTPDHPVPSPTAPAPSAKKFRPDTRFPWEREDDRGAAEAPEKLTRVKPPSLAELTLPEDELKRLRNLGILTRHRIKVGKLGVTNGIVESIHNEWRNSEVARIKCEGPPVQNMKRTHEALEERTGGLVVWRAGGACLVYRGKDYVPPPVKEVVDSSEESSPESVAKTDENVDVEDDETDERDEGSNQRTAEGRVVVPRVNSVYDPELEREMEEILSALGPRYDDWTGMKPAPVDGDLLIGPNVKFVKPFRLLPYGVKSSLTNLEMTNLRRLGRPIPPHFVLGVNKGLEGLAVAIIKLWEKSEIAKIAVKRGVQNTNHERMAEQLKRLTGGVLLARDKFYIVLYRGKDFLPPSVAAALKEREALTTALQEEEEKARLVPQAKDVLDTSVERSIAGTLAETLDAQANWEKLQTSDDEQKAREAATKAVRRDMARRIQRKISTTLAKKAKAELELQKVEKRLHPAGPLVDRENITNEERHMLSKLGLKMHAFLLLGRRGVFGGTVENMHLHWKHRELVKIIYRARDKVDLEQTARMLEYESGGVLVATVPTNKGQAILVYRGKNYQRPPELRPRTLLTKRQALKRSIEMQRQRALANHLLALENSIGNMQADLSKFGEEEMGDFEPITNDLGELPESDEREANKSIIFSGLDFPESDERETKESITFSGLDFPESDEREAKESITFSGFKFLEEESVLIRDGSVGHLSKDGNLDAIFRADPLARKEKLLLRQQALKERKRAAHFNVGRTNVVAGLARAIRIHFQKHALVKVGVKGRAKGTPVQEILHQLQEATGGTLVSQEDSKIILYRGWPEGQLRPTEGNGHWEELSPELRHAMISEAKADEDYLHESDWDESEGEDEGEAGEESEDDEIFEAEATIDSSEVDDDLDWDEFEGDDDEADHRNALELGLAGDELDGNEDEEDDDEGDHRNALKLDLAEDDNELDYNENEEDDEVDHRNPLELGLAEDEDEFR